MTLTHSRLQNVLDYAPSTGTFRWKISSGKRKAGTLAGHTDKIGYTKISIDGVKYFAHRLAWFYQHKQWPQRSIDHIDRQRNNNRIANLRDVGQDINGLNTSLRRNNSSGVTGVSFDPRRKTWVAYINRNGRKMHLGSFKDKASAAEARANAVAKAFKKQSIRRGR